MATAGDLFPWHNMLNSERQDVSPTWRVWDRVVADWANRSSVDPPEGYSDTLRTREKRRWNYLDLYMSSYLDYLVADYENWIKQVDEVLEAQDRDYVSIRVLKRPLPLE
jgi:hypothetical protein